MNPRTLFSTLGFATLLMVGCGVDDIMPEITINTPKENDVFETGDTIRAQLQFSDNETLSQYKIDIHGDHDGHGHGKGQAALPAWDTLVIGDLEGSSGTIDAEFIIPANILPGPYHITVFALDLNGNESNQTRSIVFLNTTDTVAPQVSLSSPSNGATLSSDFSVTGSISDLLTNGNSANELHQIEISVEPEGGGTERVVALYDNTDEINGVWDAGTGSFSATGLDFPNNTESGNNVLSLTVWDRYFNKSTATVSIVVN